MSKITSRLLGQISSDRAQRIDSMRTRLPSHVSLAHDSSKTGVSLQSIIDQDSTLNGRLSEIQEIEVEKLKESDKIKALDQLKSTLHLLQQSSNNLRYNLNPENQAFNYVEKSVYIVSTESSSERFLEVNPSTGAKVGRYRVAVHQVAEKSKMTIGVESSELDLENAQVEKALNSWILEKPKVERPLNAVCSSEKQGKIVSVGNGTAMISNDLSDWVSVETPADTDGLQRNWVSVCYANSIDLYVAVSNTDDANNNQNIMVSRNGQDWEIVNIPTSESLNSVCWSESIKKFVAVGENNTILHSSDGHLWHQVQPAVSRDWGTVCYSEKLNKFCAISSTENGTKGKIILSSDAINWMVIDSPIPDTEDADFVSITYSEELGRFCALRSNSGLAVNNVIVSDNGTDWTSHNMPNPGTLEWSSIAWSPSLKTFCAVAKDNSGAHISKIATSKTGKDWIFRNEPADIPFQDICWSAKNKVFVAVANSGRDNIAISGIYERSSLALAKDSALSRWRTKSSKIEVDFTHITNLPELGSICAIAQTDSDDHAVIVSENGGETWQEYEVPENNQWKSMAYNPSSKRLVAVSSNGANRIMYSNNSGKNWTIVTPDDPNDIDAEWSSITYSVEKGLYVAVARTQSTNGNNIMYSSDGVNWLFTNAPENNHWRSVIYSKFHNKFFAVSSNGTNRVMESLDGIAWNINDDLSGVGNATWRSIAVSNTGQLVAVADSPTADDELIMKSSNGINWSTHIINSSNLNIFPAYVTNAKNAVLEDDFSNPGTIITPSFTSNYSSTQFRIWSGKSDTAGDQSLVNLWRNSSDIFRAGGLSGDFDPFAEGLSDEQDICFIIESPSRFLLENICVRTTDTIDSKPVEIVIRGSHTNNIGDFVIIDTINTSDHGLDEIINYHVDNNIYYRYFAFSVKGAANVLELSRFEIRGTPLYAPNNIIYVEEFKSFILTSSKSPTHSIAPNVILSSKDSDVWTPRITVPNSSISSVCWIPEYARICGVSSHGSERVFLSDDFINLSRERRPISIGFTSETSPVVTSSLEEGKIREGVLYVHTGTKEEFLALSNLEKNKRRVNFRVGDTLRTIKEKFDFISRDSKVEAFIFENNGTYILELVSKEAGSSNSFELRSISGNASTLLSGLKRNYADARNSVLTINGARLEYDTNTIVSAIPYVRIILNRANSAGHFQEFEIKHDFELIASEIGGLLQSYNEFLKFYAYETATDQRTHQPLDTARLAKVTFVQRLKNSIEQIFGQSIIPSVGSDAAPRGLRDIGVQFETLPANYDNPERIMPPVRNHLGLISHTLFDKLRDNFEDVRRIFEFSVSNPIGIKKPLESELVLSSHNWQSYDSMPGSAAIAWNDVIYIDEIGVEIPSVPLTADSVDVKRAIYMTGQHTVTASSFSGVSNPYKAFNYSLSNSWVSDAGVFDTTTGNYTGASLIDGFQGEWIRLQTPSSFVLKKYIIYPASTYAEHKSPRNFRIYGSNNALDWTLVDEQMNINWWSDSSPLTFYAKNKTSYKNYVLVVNEIGNDEVTLDASKDSVEISSIRFFEESELSSSYSTPGRFLSIGDGGISYSETGDGWMDSEIRVPSHIPTLITSNNWNAITLGTKSQPFSLDRFPSSALTANISSVSGQMIGNGEYEISASSNNVDAFNLFTRDNTQIYESATSYTAVGGEYVGVDNISGYNGEHITIKLPRKTRISRYNFSTINNAVRGDAKEWRIYGRNDVGAWVQLDSRTIAPADLPGQNASYDGFNIASPGYYEEYALVVNKIESQGGAQLLSIAELELYGTSSWYDGTEPTETDLIKRYVMVGEGNGTGHRVAYSDDGNNWSADAVGVPNHIWSDICYSESKKQYVAISSDTGSTANRIMYSKNGVNWESVDIPIDRSFKSIAYSEELDLYVAVAHRSNGTDVNTIITSKDGKVWSIRNSPTGSSWNSIIWCKELRKFIAVGSEGDQRIMTSSNGINWNGILAPEQTNWESVAWSQDLGELVAFSSNGTNRVMTSKDGENWNLRVSSTQSEWSASAYSKSQKRFIAVSRNTGSVNSRIYRNRENWNFQSLPSNLSIQSVERSEDFGTYVAVASNGVSNGVVLGVDGNFWAQVAPTEDNQWSSICYNPRKKRFLAVAKTGVNRVMWSDDGGETWAKNDLTNPPQRSWNKVIWAPNSGSDGNGIYVAVASQDASQNTIMISNDFGENWNLIRAPEDKNWSSVTYSPELKIFVAVADDSSSDRTVMTSTDGSNWTLRTAAANRDWKSVEWCPKLKKFVAVAESGINRVMISSDGISWSLVNPDLGSLSLTKESDKVNWKEVKWIHEAGIMLAVGYDPVSSTGKLMYSSNLVNWVVLDSGIDVEFNSIAWSRSLNKFVIMSSSGGHGSVNRILTSIPMQTENHPSISRIYHPEIINADDIKITIMQNGEDGDMSKRVIIEYFDNMKKIWRNPEYADLEGKPGNQIIKGRPGTRIAGLQLGYKNGTDETIEHVYITQGIADKCYNLIGDYLVGRSLSNKGILIQDLERISKKVDSLTDRLSVLNQRFEAEKSDRIAEISAQLGRAEGARQTSEMTKRLYESRLGRRNG